MWKAISSLVILAIVAMARWGVPEGLAKLFGGFGMGALEWFDEQIRSAAHPTVFVIGVAALFAIWVLPPIRKHLLNHWFGAKRREFLNQFGSIEQTVSRRNFRWNLERAYRNHNENAKRGELADMLRKLKWPENFPPEENVVAYAEKIEWPDNNGKMLWEFMDALFTDVYDIRKRIEKLDTPYYHDLLVGRLVIGKFWNDWAQQMRDGLLDPYAVKDALDSNEPDIRALAMAKLTLGKAVGWDRSKGTTALFLLARDHVRITGGTWTTRMGNYLGGLLEGLGWRIKGNVPRQIPKP